VRKQLLQRTLLLFNKELVLTIRWNANRLDMVLESYRLTHFQQSNVIVLIAIVVVMIVYFYHQGGDVIGLICLHLVVVTHDYC
jgi:hypothetical protein